MGQGQECRWQNVTECRTRPRERRNGSPQDNEDSVIGRSLRRVASQAGMLTMTRQRRTLCQPALTID